MHKSLIRLLALFVLLVPLVAACGGTAPTTEPTTAPDTSESATTEAPTEAATDTPTEAATDTTTDATDETPTADATTTTDTTTDTLRVGLVTDLGRVNDGTFNEFAHKGAEQAANEFGLDYDFIETQTQADYEKNIQTFVSEEYDVIITVGFLIQDATLAAAQANPDITFIGVDQFYDESDPAASAPNLVGLQFREDQGGFLAGAIAGMMTQNNVIGIVGGEEIPPVKKFRNGFENGARYVNPAVNIIGVYVPSFIDPVAGASNAQQMIGEGADVIFGAGGPTGSGAIGAAAEAGVFVIGVDQDEYTTTFDSGTSPSADKILTSAIKRVDVAVYDQVKSIVEGNFQGGGIAVYEAANDGVGIADYHAAADAIPDAVKQRMEEILQKLADGSLTTGVDPVSGDLNEATIPEPEPFEP
jgi:basic membrane lipoprotein Med (substrate-binding protein (PBP1-ABC) superfamily)